MNSSELIISKSSYLTRLIPRMIFASLFLLFSCEREDMYSFTQHKLAIGDTGPGGGIVFYVTDGGAHGLEVAPVSTEWAGKQWGSSSLTIGTSNSGIGSGSSNTAIIVAWLNSNLNDATGDVTSKTDRAGFLCDQLVYGEKSDWFLPSQNELTAIWDNLVNNGSNVNNGVGNFSNYRYWSSTESGVMAYDIDFTNGSLTSSGKVATDNVRAIRKF